jgi:hypothetical protein
MGRPGDLASVFQLIDSSVFTHMPHDHVHINYRDRRLHDFRVLG